MLLAGQQDLQAREECPAGDGSRRMLLAQLQDVDLLDAVVEEGQGTLGHLQGTKGRR